VTSTDVARDLLTHSAIFFRARDPRRDALPLQQQSHKFICVAPHSADTLLLINVPKVAVEPILKVRKCKKNAPFFPCKANFFYILENEFGKHTFFSF